MEIQFVKNKPYKHIIINNFLSEKRAKDLLRALKKERFEEKDSDLFQFRQTQELKYSKNKVVKEFYRFFSSKEFLDLVGKITGKKLRKADMAGTLYIDTDYLLCHDDRLEGRKIAYVYYLSEDFKEKDGGAFVLLDSKNKKVNKAAKKYYPKWNSLLLFEVSKKSWHEVEEVVGNKKRYAIGGWFH